jgi:polysaccharide biosynthesis transport protein
LKPIPSLYQRFVYHVCLVCVNQCFAIKARKFQRACMFFDESNPNKSNLKPKLRLSGSDDGRGNGETNAYEQPISARERLENARFQKEGSTSLLDRIDAMTRAEEESKVARQAERATTTRQEQIAETDLQTKIARIARGEDLESAPREKDRGRYEQAVATKSKVEAAPIADEHQEIEVAPIDARQNWSQDHGSAAPLVHPVYVINAIRKWRYLIAATTILGGLIGVGAAISTPKLYYSSASLKIDPQNFKVLENDLTPDVFLSEAAMAIVDSQLNIIRSPVVMDKVVSELTLAEKPEFNGTKKSGLSSFMGFLDILSGGKSEGWQTTAAKKKLYNNTFVKRQPNNFIVDVGAYSEDANLAADIANKIVDSYFAERADDRADTAGRTSKSISERLPALKKQVEVAESKAARFKAENDLFDAQGRSIDEEEILRLNDQLASARSTTISLNARADSAKAVTVDGILAYGLPEELSSSALNGLRGQYSTAKQRYDGLQAKLGPRHPDLQQAGVESASLRASIETEIKRVRLAIQTELRRAVQTEQALAARLAELKAKLANSGDALVQLREIEREAASARTVYEQFLVRAQETGEQGTIDSTNVKQIIRATPSDEAVGTSRKLIAIGGVLGGFLLGLGLAIMSGVWNALRERYAGSIGANHPLVPTPRPPSGQKARTIRGMFQSRDAVNEQRVVPKNSWSKRNSFAQETAPAIAAPSTAANSSQDTPQTVQPAVQIAAAQQPQYAPMPVQQPVQMPMFIPQQPVLMPQFQQPWFVPHPTMMAQMMPPQMMPQMMPAPVQMAHYSAPVAVPAQQSAQPETAPLPVPPSKQPCKSAQNHCRRMHLFQTSKIVLPT